MTTTLTFEERIQEAGFERRDTVQATVVRKSVKGVWLEFGNESDNGFIGFAYATLKKNDRVLCSIRKINLDTEFIILSVDSVLAYNAA